MLRRRILLVDDDTRIVAALRMRLEESGFEVVSATSGDEGLDAARQNPPAAVVLDLRMPGGMDGFEVCRSMKQDEHLRAIPIVVLSANGDESARREAFDAGAIDFLPKPYNSLDVLAAIRAVVGA